ncbi:neuropilin-1-like [Amphiura filiformis]|uniref:neuropilin-1-like n=1 Tax=Amphiura filiformis TaxID=82378 RepID=UPI003B21EDA7
MIQDKVLWIEHRATMAGHGYEVKYDFVNSPAGTPECNQIYTDQEGILESPNYPDKYPANAMCQTIIVVPPGNTIQLNFRGFRLEDAYYGGCPYDKLVVVDYIAAEGPKTKSYCGLQEQMIWDSGSNVIQLNFVSDSSDEYKGYRIKFKII